MSLNRRQFVVGSGAMAITSPAIAQQQHEGTLVIRTSGGALETALRKAFFDRFTKETGVRVLPVATSYGEMLAKTAAMSAAGRVEWDIILPNVWELPNLAEYVEDLGDCSAFPSVKTDGVDTACSRYGVLFLTGARALTYNKEAFPNGGPKTWADLWDVERFPGRRAFPSVDPFPCIMAALLADGVTRDKLFPLDLDRAFKKLDEIKPRVAVWWRSGDQCQQVFRSGDAQLGMAWAGRALAVKRQGVPLVWTYQDSISDFGAWSILKNAPHPKAARLFIDFFVKNPAAHLQFTREIGYATSNKQALSEFTASEKEEFLATADQFAGVIHLDASWMKTNQGPTMERWNRWIAS